MFLGYHLTHTHLLVWNWIELIWDPTWLLTDKGWYFPRRATWPSTSRVLGKPYVWGNSLADTYNVYIYIYYTYYTYRSNISSTSCWPYPQASIGHPTSSHYWDPPLTKRSSWRSCWETVRPQTAALNKKKTSGDVSINGSHGTYDWYDCVWVIYYKKMADTEGLEIGMG